MIGSFVRLRNAAGLTGAFGKPGDERHGDIVLGRVVPGCVSEAQGDQVTAVKRLRAPRGIAEQVESIPTDGPIGRGAETMGGVHLDTMPVLPGHPVGAGALPDETLDLRAVGHLVTVTRICVSIESMKNTNSSVDQVSGRTATAIDNQIAAVSADQTGEPLNLKAMRWVDDPETGQRVRKEVTIRVRRWWWKDEAGQVMLDVRYGNKRMELAPKKPTIEVGSMDRLLPTLEQVREAVVAGELDKAIAASSVRPDAV